jgi:3'-phosphoadenosine 5'-phosphosulfate synthase
MLTNGFGGDNDPLDVMELGTTPLSMGSVTPIKVLGALQLIDEGETDHKILAIRTSDPIAHRVNNMDDLERYRPGTLARLVDWLVNYKTAEGKGKNTLAKV